MSEVMKIKNGRNFGKVRRMLEELHGALKRNPGLYITILRDEVVKNPSRSPIKSGHVKYAKAYIIVDDFSKTLNELKAEYVASKKTNNYEAYLLNAKNFVNMYRFSGRNPWERNFWENVCSKMDKLVDGGLDVI